MASDQDNSGLDAPGSQFHRPILQSMPDTRQQSFDEIYGPPENFLEIEVRSLLPHAPYPQPHTVRRTRDTRGKC
jgi:sorting nexin-3/12